MVKAYPSGFEKVYADVFYDSDYLVLCQGHNSEWIFKIAMHVCSSKDLDPRGIFGYVLHWINFAVIKDQKCMGSCYHF